MNKYYVSKDYWERYGRRQYCPGANEKYRECGAWCPGFTIHPPIGTLNGFVSLECFPNRVTFDIEIINEGGNNK